MSVPCRDIPAATLRDSLDASPFPDCLVLMCASGCGRPRAEMEWGRKGNFWWPNGWYDHCCRTCSYSDGRDHGPWCQKKQNATEKKQRRAEKKEAEKKEAEKKEIDDVDGDVRADELGGAATRKFLQPGPCPCPPTWTLTSAAAAWRLPA